MNESIEKTIDIEKILRDKMGKKARYVPRFVISWLKKIIHEDEVNRFLWENRKLEGTEWLTACVQYLDMTLDIVGAETCPTNTMESFILSFPIILWVVRTVFRSAQSSVNTMMGSFVI